jgi:hypothetical protein
LYLAYKLARRDLYHWAPIEGAAHVPFAILCRVGIKTIADFTGVVQFRAAGEMGGAAWTFSQGTALVTSLVATHIYLSSDKGGAAAGVIGESFVWTTVGVLSGSLAVGYACFLLLMKRRFVSTFFSLKTGHAWVKGFFLDYEEDRIKMFVHSQNRKQWLSIRDDVAQYTMDNWERWMEEKPEWFNDNFKAFVDEDMIPAESLRRIKMGNSSRRRSSLAGLLGGGARVAPGASGE